MDAFGNALGNSIVGAARNKSNPENKSTTTSNSQPNGTTGGSNTSQGATDLTNQGQPNSQSATYFPDDGTEKITVTPNWDEINSGSRSPGYVPFWQSQSGADFLNRSNKNRHDLQVDYHNKVERLKEHQQFGVDMQKLIDRNKINHEFAPFDLEKWIGYTTDWQMDLETDIATDPRIQWNEVKPEPQSSLDKISQFVTDTSRVANFGALGVLLNTADHLEVDKGFTLTYGLQGQKNAIIGGAAVTPVAGYFNVNFEEAEINIGNFSAWQGGSEVNLAPGGAMSWGLDSTILFDGGNFDKSVAGPFMTAGGSASLLGKEFGVEGLMTIPKHSSDPSYLGISIFTGLGTPSVGGNIHFGHATMWDNNVNIKFSELIYGDRNGN